ncbi:hypothetical protein C2G38_2235503 [Gigaspora rosea]|uniref:Uncharacterized protein n=1 Tax=Gigaspora rosea TaxID=44941 RepID=A0A397TYA3_9GLOM|nr:hypothetical protein C2G38_2235503 [Gigaspora rosea]
MILSESAKGSESPSEQTDQNDFIFRVIQNNQQQLAKIQKQLNDILNNQNESEITPRKSHRNLQCCLVYTYVVGKNKNLPSPEARYQEVEITEDDRIYDILRKMDRLYLIPYKVTIQVSPNNKFNPKETITTTTELNAWDFKTWTIIMLL